MNWTQEMIQWHTQFWTFGRGRLDVKVFSKSSRRKEYLYIIYILYISIKYVQMSTFPYLQKSRKTFGVFPFILYFCTQKFY